MDFVDAMVRFDPPMDGEMNMQVDNDLLHSLTPASPVTLRLYRWSQPTLSLGRFQQEDAIFPDWKVAQGARVRRRTGGGAILHDQEWTYSLAIPNSPHLGLQGIGLKGHSEEIYRAVHLAVVSGLRELGWDAALSEECSCPLAEDNAGEEAFLCFLRRSPVDVVVGTDKILGSAQRRANTGLLQHGSFLLRRSELAPELPGILDLPRNRREPVGLNVGAGCSKAETAADGDSVFQITDHELLQFAARLENSADIRVGLWLAKQIMAGVETIFRCNWKLAGIDSVS